MQRRTNSAVWLGTRWRIQLCRNGVHRVFYSSTPGRRGQRECQAKADKWLESATHDEGTPFAVLWEQYLTDVQQSSSKSNYEGVRKMGQNYILPELERVKIGALTEGHLQDVLNKAYKHGCLRPDHASTRTEPLSRKTLQGIRAAETAFLKWARKHGYTTLRPEELTIPGGARLKGKNILQPEALRTLFSVDTVTRRGRQEFDENIYAYRFLVATGLRPGELVGLCCDDVQGHTVSVRRAVNRYGETTRGKNENAVRSFELNSFAYEVYSQQLALLHRQGLPTGEGCKLFPVRNQQSLYNYWKHYQLSNGIPHVSLYELRHSFVSIAQDLPDGKLKRLVGHSRNMDTRGVYSHQVEGEAEATAREMGEIIKQILG